MERTTLLSNLGAVGSAFASALCCVGPILYVSLGVGAGLASTFEPLRPWFLGGAVLFLGLGFHGAYVRPPRSCEEELRPEPGDCCVSCSYGSTPCPSEQGTCG